MMEILANPTNLGKMRGSNGIGESEENVSSEIVRVYIKVEDNIILKAQAEVFGNAALIVCADYICGMINNKPLDYALTLRSDDVSSELIAFSQNKSYVIDLCIQAVKFAIIDYKDRVFKEKYKVKKV